MPKTSTELWQEKINKTKQRDISNMKEFVGLGWKPIIMWECELKPEKRNVTLEKLYDLITIAE